MSERPILEPPKEQGEIDTLADDISEFEMLDDESKTREYTSILIKNASLRNDIRVKSDRVRKLKRLLNQQHFRGNNRKVSVKYAQEIIIFEASFQAALSKARKDNKKKSCPILYQTSAPKLMKNFNIGERVAERVIRVLQDMGAWEFVRNLPGSVQVYKVGEVKSDGKYQRVHSFMSLSRKQMKEFYKREIGKIG